jgi:quinol monooxygenase YgiN
LEGLERLNETGVIDAELLAKGGPGSGPAGLAELSAHLFGKGDGYVETLLFRDTDRPTRYLTIDRWRSRAAYEAFVSSSRSLYAALDRRGDALTVSERRVGTFCDAMAWEP